MMAKHLEAPLPPGSTIGILGGGQLGRMLALAAAQLGLKSHIYAPEADSCAFQVSDAHTIAAYQDSDALAAFVKAVDVVTYEFENVPAATARVVEEFGLLAPNSLALATAQDRVTEKDFVRGLGIETAPYAAVGTEAELRAAVEQIGKSSILKTRRFGYDGKGQVRLSGQVSPVAAWAEIGNSPAILEGLVKFDNEVSVIVARSWAGEIAVYDVPENRHENQILRSSTVPGGISIGLSAKARVIAGKIVDALGYVGVMGIELFVVGDQLLVNELAPRVHNSGHWTMDACYVSQFEQHIRAVAGWPLGDPKRHSDVTMYNLLGAEADDWAKYAASTTTAVHLYGKGESRRGRKMGHINVLTPRQG